MTYREHLNGLKVRHSLYKVGCFSFPGRDPFPFSSELSQDWKSESPLYIYTRSLGGAAVFQMFFHFTHAICLLRGDPEKTPWSSHIQGSRITSKEIIFF